MAIKNNTICVIVIPIYFDSSGFIYHSMTNCQIVICMHYLILYYVLLFNY